MRCHFFSTDTFEENENPRDFERGFPDWLYENNEDNSAGAMVYDHYQ